MAYTADPRVLFAAERTLLPVVVPPGYWTHAGVALHIVIAFIAAAFALRFLWPNQWGDAPW